MRGGQECSRERRRGVAARPFLLSPCQIIGVKGSIIEKENPTGHRLSKRNQCFDGMISVILLRLLIRDLLHIQRC